MMTIIASAKAGLTALEAASSGMKWLVVAGVAIALVGIYSLWHHEVYESGVNDTIAGIARADKTLVDRAWQGRQQWQACRDLNRRWDQTTGSCQ